MAIVMQGDAYNIPVTIKSGNGTLITPEIAACVEITVGQFTKRWPGQVTFDEKTGQWQFPVTQKQTFRFLPGTAVVQARVVFQDGSIMGGSGAPVRVEQSASHGTLPQPEKTEAATGSAPKATEVTIPTVHDIDVSLHSQVILSDPIKAPYIGENGNWYEYDAEKGTFVDTGTSASGIPPIAPDTAGKYLTNDGSKAEWGAIDIPQSDWEQTDESAADYVKNRPFGKFSHHNIDFLIDGEGAGTLETSPGFYYLYSVLGEKTARIERYGDIICQGKAVTTLDETYGNITITFTSDDNLTELVFSGREKNLDSLTINKSNIDWSPWNIYSLSIDGLTYIEDQKLSRYNVEGALPYTNMKDYIPVSDGNDSWVTRSIESINPIFQLSGASAGQIVKITAVDESGKPTAWEAVDMPSGRTDISLGLTAATVGQTIVVKAVDADGKPTEWEAVDAVGGETWEKISEIVIPEGADESTVLTINKDSDGNPFSLVKARLCAKFPKYTGATTIPNFSFAMLNGKTTGRVAPLAYTSVWPKVSASNVTGTVYEIDVLGAQQIEHVIKSGIVGWPDDSSRDYVVYGGTTDTETTWFGDTLWAKPITSIGGTGMLIYSGCRFVLYGVRA